MPFYEVYASAGDFTVKAKCMTSLRENAILYGIIGIGAIVGERRSNEHKAPSAWLFISTA